MNQNVYREYLAILREEIVPALGCTEPIAIAYAAAKARSVLGRLPEHIDVRCSGNIIKNVKAVIVPTTGNMKGIETSAVLGAVGGNPDKKLEVLTDVSPKDLELTWELAAQKDLQRFPAGRRLQPADHRGDDCRAGVRSGGDRILPHQHRAH